jgi:prolyl-tRNA synthetase
VRYYKKEVKNMAEKQTKKFVESITKMDDDFAKWYTDIVVRAGLASYSGIRGCMVIEPYGYAIWENFQRELGARFKETGHENVYMPLFIPESLLNKEKDHVEGFAPEVAWVTMGGNEKLAERLCVRPTSETLFCDYFSKCVKSHRDLPKLLNQWCSVVRWEKTTRPFLRGMEVLWQEGHTGHASETEAMEETRRMHEIYCDFFENFLAIPVIKGRKTESEKFAGAEITYTVESVMPDGKALQSATSHYFGDRFARAFDIRFSNENNELEYAYQTSWGLTTRVIGALIMVHGDDSGLRLPPKAAPIQIIIVPVSQQKPGVLEKAREIKEILSKKFRVKLDDSDKNPGWKFSEYEMLGVPLRLEIGPRDIENNQAVLARRDTGEKIIVSLDSLDLAAADLLEKIQANLYSMAKKSLSEKTSTALNYDEFKKIANERGGFIKAMWCGSAECEAKIKEETGATSRCISLEEGKLGPSCVYCGKKAETMIYWAKAY